jgi:hypothetical protein
MSAKQVDVTPSTSLIASLSAQNLTWREVLGELIDNAFDANANSVDISFESGRLVITDDGNGCDDLTSLATLGKHERSATTKLGRYGIGAKDAMLWVGGERSTITVESVHRGIFRSGAISWASMIVNGRWVIDDWNEVRAARPGERGTRIVISPVKRTVLHGAQWSDLLADVGYLYSPAIKRGRQITVRRTKTAPTSIVRYELPPFEGGHVDTTIDVGGKTARVIVGIVKPGEPNHRNGITYTHGFRVIKAASPNGCGRYNTLRVAGVVDLDEGWPLTKNKDNLSAHADELYAAVETAAELVLRRADVASRQLDTAALESRVNELLSSAVESTAGPDAKAKRGTGDRSGVVTPKNTGRRHTRAALEQPGKTFVGTDGASGAKALARAGFKIQFSDHVGPRGEIGVFQASETRSTPHTVTLYCGHALLGVARETKNEMAILVCATALIAGACSSKGQQSLFRNVPDGFEAALGELLRGARLDGKAIVE